MKKQDIISQLSKDHNEHKNYFIQFDYANFWTVTIWTQGYIMNLNESKLKELRLVMKKNSGLLFGIEADCVRFSDRGIHFDFYND